MTLLFAEETVRFNYFCLKGQAGAMCFSSCRFLPCGEGSSSFSVLHTPQLALP